MEKEHTQNIKFMRRHKISTQKFLTVNSYSKKIDISQISNLKHLHWILEKKNKLNQSKQNEGNREARFRGDSQGQIPLKMVDIRPFSTTVLFQPVNHDEIQACQFL